MVTASSGTPAATSMPHDGQRTTRRRWRSINGLISGSSILSCSLMSSAARSPGRLAQQQGHWSARCSTTRSTSLLMARLMTLMTKLAAPGLCLIPPLLAVSRGRLRRGPRGLRRPLHPQHQIDQFFLRKTLQIPTIHDPMDSAITRFGKGVGNYPMASLAMPGTPSAKVQIATVNSARSMGAEG
jgi:hypothetical protein